MKRYIYISLVLIIFFLITFSAVEYFDIPLLKDPSYLQQKGGMFAAGGGFLLLVSDIILPVPGSLIMMGNGAIFGLYLGTILSVAGGLGMSIVGFLAGRRGNKFISKFVSEEEKQTAARLMERWGYLAVLVTRPVPLLSETVIIIAGSTGLRTGKTMLASLLGYLPGAYIYALAGTSAISVDKSAYSFLIVLCVAGLFWFLGRFIRKGVA